MNEHHLIQADKPVPKPEFDGAAIQATAPSPAHENASEPEQQINFALSQGTNLTRRALLLGVGVSLGLTGSCIVDKLREGEAQAQREALEAQIDQLRAELAQRIARLEQQPAIHPQQARVNRTVEQRLRAIQRELDQLKRRTKRSEEDIDRWADTVNRDRDHAKKRIDDTQLRVSGLRDELERQDKKIQGTRDGLAQHDKRFEKTREEIGSTWKRIGKVEKFVSTERGEEQAQMYLNIQSRDGEIVCYATLPDGKPLKSPSPAFAQTLQAFLQQSGYQLKGTPIITAETKTGPHKGAAPARALAWSIRMQKQAARGIKEAFGKQPTALQPKPLLLSFCEDAINIDWMGKPPPGNILQTLAKLLGKLWDTKPALPKKGGLFLRGGKRFIPGK